LFPVSCAGEGLISAKEMGGAVPCCMETRPNSDSSETVALPPPTLYASCIVGQKTEKEAGREY